MPGFPVLHYLLEFAQIHVLESVMLSNHPIHCHPLLLLPSIFPSIRIFSNELALCIRWSKSLLELCWGPASAGSRGYPRDERHWREKTRETSLDRAKSARERERKRERERERERERDQTRGAAESGRAWQCFIFYPKLVHLTRVAFIP